MRFPLRRIVLGFAVGASAGWVAGLLRRPKDAPPGTGADAAEHMPQEEFGDLAGGDALEGAEEIAQEPTAPVEAYDAGSDGDDAEEGSGRKPPRKALPETVTPPPGTETLVGDSDAATDGASEPATPAPRRRAKSAKKDAVKSVADPVAEAVREGRAEVTERLAGLEDAVAPAATPIAPETRRRRKRTE